MTDDSLETVRPYLLPNEGVELICRTLSGFLVLSNRRFILLKEDRRRVYHIEKAIPFDCISSIEQMKVDRFEISGIVLDQYGQLTNEVRSFTVKAPRAERKEFQSAMSQCIDVLDEIKNLDGKSAHHDTSYLEHLPQRLTKNGILDLNTILQDQPIHNELVHEAEKFLGAEPFIIEESLRDGNDKESGILFAAGKRGYYWIKGKKTGRFMSNVIIDTVEWNNIHSFSYRWNIENTIINVTYSLTSDGKKSTTRYQWKPLVNDETLQYPWLHQQMNGPWILVDIIHKYAAIPFPHPTKLGPA